MSTPPEKPKGRIDSLLDEEELRSVGESVEQRPLPSFVQKHLEAAQQKRVSAADEPPPPPRWPMLSGIFTFPFYLNTLGPWMFISLGLMVFGWLFMFWLEYGDVMGATTAYYLGLPALAAGILVSGYAASCCFNIIEKTANGWDTFEVSPGNEWKEWIWSFLHLTVLASQAGVVGYALQLVCSSDSWLPMAAGTLAVFPLVLLGALAAGGAWAPMAILTILRSLFLTWRAWALFYLETGTMIVAWTLLTRAGLVGETSWLTPLFAGPLLAAILLIYARLTGRLAGCIAAATQLSIEENADE
jgi:hypothetical protein